MADTDRSRPTQLCPLITLEQPSQHDWRGKATSEQQPAAGNAAEPTGQVLPVAEFADTAAWEG